jgi:ketosteroid isomerase-like protein
MKRLVLTITTLALLAGLPLAAQKSRLTKENLHREAIQEELSVRRSDKDLKVEKEIIQELYAVMDAFVAKDLESLARHIHPRMVEFDSMSPYREVGKANFLEHMAHFFASPQHIEDHFIRIKEPFVQSYGDNVAVVTFHYDTEASVGGEFNQNYGKASFVFVKDLTKASAEEIPWMLAVCHYSTLRPSLR